MATKKVSIPRKVGRNLTKAAAKKKGFGGPPCTKPPDNNPCTGGETKCEGGDEYTCGKNGWYKSGKCSK